ncbi:MAG: hypothetical protein JW807_16700 [Spirochaetes bacterium]|nr:hypothetical protein [Spirochaetota bacterium]
MRKFYLFSAALAMIVAFSVSSVMGNTGIMKKHAGKKKDGKSINCGYCHTGQKIEKKKGQNMAALKQLPGCKGSGCH